MDIDRYAPSPCKVCKYMYIHIWIYGYIDRYVCSISDTLARNSTSAPSPCARSRVGMVCIPTHTHPHIFTHTHTHTHTHTFLSLFLSIYICPSIYLCITIYLSIYIHIYIYTYITISISIYLSIYECIYIDRNICSLSETLARRSTSAPRPCRVG